MKICIISGGTHRRLQSHANHAAYAKLHAYDVREDLGPYPDLSNPYFFKISAVAAALPHYEWVLWLDDDAFFTDFRKKLESLIKVLKPGAFIAIAKSPVNSIGAWTFLNTGVFLLKNCRESFDCLTQVAQTPLATVQTWWKKSHVGRSTNTEQDIMTYVLLEHFAADQVRYFDYRELNARPYHYGLSSDEHFIVHFAGGKEKAEAVAQFAARYGLDETLIPLHHRPESRPGEILEQQN